MWNRIRGSWKYIQEGFYGRNKEVGKQLRLIRLTLLEWHGWRSQRQINLVFGLRMGCSTSSLDFETRLAFSPPSLSCTFTSTGWSFMTGLSICRDFFTYIAFLCFCLISIEISIIVICQTKNIRTCPSLTDGQTEFLVPCIWCMSVTLLIG